MLLLARLFIVDKVVWLRVNEPLHMCSKAVSVLEQACDGAQVALDCRCCALARCLA